MKRILKYKRLTLHYGVSFNDWYIGIDWCNSETNFDVGVYIFCLAFYIWWDKE